MYRFGSNFANEHDITRPDRTSPQPDALSLSVAVLVWNRLCVARAWHAERRTKDGMFPTSH